MLPGSCVPVCNVVAAGLNAVNVGDEGGFAPPIDTFEQALDLLTEAIAAAGYTGRVSNIRGLPEQH